MRASLSSGSSLGLLVVALGLLVPALAHAQQPPPSTAPLVCESKAGEHITCPGDTSAGVALVKSTGQTTCLLGKNWGYDEKGVWVTDGCGGQFQLGQPSPAGAQAPITVPAVPGPNEPTKLRIDAWGEFEPGDGFLVGRNSKGELAISGYALLRYVNQTPGTQTFTDHLGNTRTVDGRNDIWPTESWFSSRGGSAMRS
jgi:hypothetical protein